MKRAHPPGKAYEEIARYSRIATTKIQIRFKYSFLSNPKGLKPGAREKVHDSLPFFVGDGS